MRTFLRSTRLGLLPLLSFLPAATASAQSRSPEARVISALRADAIMAPLRFLSDDLLEGRGTGARGGELAAHYLASQFMLMGLEPAGDNDSWFHRVPIVTMVPEASLQLSGASSRVLRFREDFVAWSEQAPPEPAAGQAAAPAQHLEAGGELVFVGFGITAPEWNWDDYKGVDVRGKVLLMLVNDPGLRNPDIFRGRILTYYGRWTYKLEEAARRGAVGVLMVHNDTMATYGWPSVVNSWTGDQVRLITPNTSLAWGGWITQGAVAVALRDAGRDLDQLMREAATPVFRPVATGITVRGEVRSVVRFSTADNVVARLPGSDPALRDEAVLVTAHYDHHGFARPVNGDSIMNGALDNASGTATILGIAGAFASSGVRARRSVVFVAFTGEEKGLLGSQAFALRPPASLPMARAAAVLNLDGANLYAPTRDMGALGTDLSGLGAVFARAARAEGLRVAIDSASLLRGLFYRSDHFPLAKAGVPGLSFQTGTDAVGRPAGWMAEQRERYNRERYHQPGDELLPEYTVEGALQQARVLVRVALEVANTTAMPAWGPRAEFRRP